MQFHYPCGGDTPRTPRGMSQWGDSTMFFPSSCPSSPASPSKSFCRCPLTFLHSIHRRRPDEKFARSLSYSLNRKPFWDDGGPGSLGLHCQSSLGCSSNQSLGGLGSRCVVHRYSFLPRPCKGSTLASTVLVIELVLPSPGKHAPDHPRRESSVDHPYFTLPRAIVHRPGYCGVARGSTECLGGAEDPQRAWCCLL